MTVSEFGFTNDESDLARAGAVDKAKRYQHIPFENIECPYCGFSNHIDAVDLPKSREMPQCEKCDNCCQEYNVVMCFEARELGCF